MIGYIAGRQRLILMSFSAMLLLFLLTSSACVCLFDPANYFYVDNQTDQTLVFSIDELQHGNLPPGEITEIITIVINPSNVYTPDEKFLIEAKTSKGEVVYSEEFTWQELDDMDWTIVIPPPLE